MLFFVASRKKDWIDVGFNFVNPLAAKAVRQMSNGYVANVAAVPASAPEQNATADGLVLRFCIVSTAC